MEYTAGSCKGPADARQGRQAHVSGIRSRAGSWEVVLGGVGHPRPQPGMGTAALPAKGLLGLGRDPLPQTSPPKGGPALDRGLRVGPALRGTGPGGAAPVGVGRGRSSTGSVGAGCGGGARPSQRGCPGRGTRPGGARSPPLPRPLFSPQRSPFFVPLSNWGSQPIAIEPAGFAAS